MNNKKALLLIGSPAGEKSTSASLGNYLISKLEESEMTTEKVFVHRIINREEKIKELFEMINDSDLIILSFPLYVDSLPAPVIKVMELIKEERDKIEKKNTPNFIAICNNGFPEGSQTMVALKICKNFSKDCGFIWKGDISIGGGGTIINRTPLEERKGVEHIRNGLDITANALKSDKEIPQEAIDEISKKSLSPILYLTIYNLFLLYVVRARKKILVERVKNTKTSLKERPSVLGNAIWGGVMGALFGALFGALGGTVIGWLIDKGRKKKSKL